MDSVYISVGINIKMYRVYRKLSQSAIADKLGLKRASISNYEKGLQRVPIHIVYKICAILDIELSDILPKQKRLKI